MRVAVAVLIAVLAGEPAFGSSCLYRSGVNNSSVSFQGLNLQSYDGQYRKATVVGADGVSKTCRYVLRDEVGSEIDCPGGTPSAFIIAGSTAEDARGGEILVFDNLPFYRDASCKP